jgi:hypothetical protein
MYVESCLSGVENYQRFSEDVFVSLGLAGAPGKYLVNLIAPLKYVPAWVPGAEFQSVARRVREQVLRLMENPYQERLQNMARHMSPVVS